MKEVPGFEPYRCEYTDVASMETVSLWVKGPIKKQLLSSEELNRQNIRGYAGLVQELWADGLVYSPKNILKNPSIDPLQAIGIDASKTRDLVEGVELVLSTVDPKNAEALRLRFRLDGQEGSFMAYREIGEQTETKTTKGMADYHVHRGLRQLRSHDSMRLLRHRIWGKSSGYPPFL